MENELTDEEIEGLIVRLGGVLGVRRFLAGKSKVVPVVEPVLRWSEENGVISFTVTSNGMTGPEWIAWFAARGIELRKEAKDILNSEDFKATTGVTYYLKVLNGEVYSDYDRVTEYIRADATRRGFVDPHPEVACLIRDQFSDEEIEEMSLTWLIIMHKPIEHSGGVPLLLRVDRVPDGPWLHANRASPDNRWFREGGFVFAAPHIGAQDPNP